MKDSILVQKLNEHYSSLSYEEAVEKFDYLTVKSRNKPATKKIIERHYAQSKLGQMLKKYDPIAFYASRADMEDTTEAQDDDFKYSKSKIQKLPVTEVLIMIHNNEIHESSINHMSKEKLRDFVIEVFNKGRLNDYLQVN